MISLLKAFMLLGPYLIILPFASPSVPQYLNQHNSVERRATAQSWCVDNITSMNSFGHIIKVAYGNGNQEFVKNPLGSDTVIKIKYPAASYKPSAIPVGGLGFYADPLDLSTAKTVTLSYQVYFPSNFNFVKGGKLPGLFAGRLSCSGGSGATDCFSTRFMFRESGVGEIYLYVNPLKQVPSYCQIPRLTVCDPVYGDSVGRGSFKFIPGTWNSLQQSITLNTLGKADGILRVYYNGRLVIYFDKMAWQGDTRIPFIGMQFETFFGGSDASWATPTTQYTHFRKFSISYQK